MKSTTLFNQKFDSLQKSYLDKIDGIIKQQQKYPGFEKTKRNLIIQNILSSLKIGQYPKIQQPVTKSEILNITENEALNFIPTMPHTLNNRAVEIRHVTVSIAYEGELTLFNYSKDANPFIFSGTLYAMSIQKDIYLKINSNEIDAQYVLTEKNNFFHLLSTRLEVEKLHFDNMIDIVKKQIENKIDTIFKNIDDSDDFDKLTN
jgi:hypothetical protein